MVFFHDVFDALFRLCADSEANVQNAAQFLDNLVKVSYMLPLQVTAEHSNCMLDPNLCIQHTCFLASIQGPLGRGMVPIDHTVTCIPRKSAAAVIRT